MAVHGGAGRPEAAAGAASVLHAALPGLPPTTTAADLADRIPTALGTRGAPPGGGLTLAAALRRVADTARADRARAELTRPSPDGDLVVPADRAPAAQAHDHGLELAELAMATADPAAALRIGLEAHTLLAWGSAEQTFAMRYQLDRIGPTWARVLVRCAVLAVRGGERALAEDLAAWAVGVADRLLPHVGADPAARAAVRDALRVHRALRR
jgi:hypothetical protein